MLKECVEFVLFRSDSCTLVYKAKLVSLVHFKSSRRGKDVCEHPLFLLVSGNLIDISKVNQGQR